ncbi:Hpt domain-containing protein [Tateyamaria sp.]|uniref:Hpt domain-containing protein n=1 Tax=Tateyamaria sp. TaxID=1929288 RepID=UPI00329F5587
MIDWQRVINLKNEIGQGDFDEVVPLFLEEVSEITNRLKKTPILDQLETDLHSLKGCALNLGFSEFSMMCSKGESLAAKGGAGSVDLAAILTSFDISCEEFLNGLEHGKIS